MRVVLGVMMLGSLFAAGAARANCGHSISGPLDKEPPFYFSSSCFKVPDGVVLRQQVCSVSPTPIAFHWTKLNWVSGSAGIERGGCLVLRSSTQSAVRIPGSQIKANIKPSPVTDVYLPDLGKENNDKFYFETVEGGGPRVEGGSPEPFRFQVSYVPAGGSVRIRATMSGEKPILVVVLPRSIKSADDLNKVFPNEYLKQISPYIDFKGGIYRVADKDPTLQEYVKENELTARASAVYRGEVDTANADFTMLGSVGEAVRNLSFCVGQSEQIVTCFQAGAAL